MDTLYITHPDCWEHDTGLGHPECAERLTAIEERLNACHLLDWLRYVEAPTVATADLLHVHSGSHVQAIVNTVPAEGHRYLDPDTRVGPGSLKAAERAAGAVVLGVEEVLAGRAQAAFCAVRPPGHHANSEASSGFCVFNNIAIGAYKALAAPGIDRVAVFDFDVHHGNGTEAIFAGDERVLFCSTLQHPFYPNGDIQPISATRVSVPLAQNDGSSAFRQAVLEHWLPAVEAFKPQFLLISAGFDAHRDDDMGGLNFTDTDYAWVTRQIRDWADRYAEGRLVSSLEGGYELKSLARSVAEHVRVLARLEHV